LSYITKLVTITSDQLFPFSLPFFFFNPFSLPFPRKAHPETRPLPLIGQSVGKLQCFPAGAHTPCTSMPRAFRWHIHTSPQLMHLILVFSNPDLFFVLFQAFDFSSLLGVQSCLGFLTYLTVFFPIFAFCTCVALRRLSRLTTFFFPAFSASPFLDPYPSSPLSRLFPFFR